MFAEIRQWVKKVPRGKVVTYGQVAAAAGFPRASRQVAWALKTFDPSLPWHRVIGKSSVRKGKILLRGASGVEQAQRLAVEGVRVQGILIDLAAFGFVYPEAARQGKKQKGKMDPNVGKRDRLTR